MALGVFHWEHPSRSGRDPGRISAWAERPAGGFFDIKFRSGILVLGSGVRKHDGQQPAATGSRPTMPGGKDWSQRHGVAEVRVRAMAVHARMPTFEADDWIDGWLGGGRWVRVLWWLAWPQSACSAGSEPDWPTGSQRDTPTIRPVPSGNLGD